jgi:hypothetical protein
MGKETHELQRVSGDWFVESHIAYWMKKRERERKRDWNGSKRRNSSLYFLSC